MSFSPSSHHRRAHGESHGHGQFPQLEEAVLDFWQRERLFYRVQEQRRGSKEYLFYDGPPFANGLPHYGHILANTIKDVVPRYWTMRGFYVERRFGWDCHGLPVEYEIEKREGFKGRQDILRIGVERFNTMCRESVMHYTREWQRTITRLGRWVDWDNQYRTMDLSFMGVGMARLQAACRQGLALSWPQSCALLTQYYRSAVKLRGQPELQGNSRPRHCR